MKQNKRIKRVCSNAVKSRYVQNRRTFLVSFGSVLCFGVSSVLYTVFFPKVIIGKQYLPFWFYFVGRVLCVAGSHAMNPFIYILNKKRITFWKLCSSWK